MVIIIDTHIANIIAQCRDDFPCQYVYYPIYSCVYMDNWKVSKRPYVVLTIILCEWIRVANAANSAESRCCLQDIHCWRSHKDVATSDERFMLIRLFCCCVVGSQVVVDQREMKLWWYVHADVPFCGMHFSISIIINTLQIINIISVCKTSINLLNISF